MRISKNEPERKTLVIPRPQGQPERVIPPAAPANEPELVPAAPARPEPLRRVA